MLRPEFEHVASVLPYRMETRDKSAKGTSSARKSQGVGKQQENAFGWLRAAFSTPYRLLVRVGRYLMELFQHKAIAWMSLVGFLSSRASLFGQVCPFGPAYFVLVVLAYPELTWPVFTAVALGTLSVSRLQFWVWLCGGALAWYLLREKPGIFRKFSPALIASFSFVAAFSVVNLVQSYLLGTTMSWMWVAVYVILLHITVSLIRPLVSARDLKLGEWLSSEQMAALLLVLAASFLGLSGLSIGMWNWQLGLSLFAVLVICSQWDFGVATVASLCLGALTFPFSESLATAIGTFGLLGMGTSLGAKFGKPGIAIGFAAANLFISMHIPDVSTLQMWWLHGAVALAGFLLVPAEVLARWVVYLPGTRATEQRRSNTESRMQREVNTRFMELSEMFSDLAAAFDYLPKGINSEVVDPSWLLDNLSKRVCVGCGTYETCWKEDFYTTSNTLLNLCTLVEKASDLHLDDLIDAFKPECERKAELANGVNHLLELMQVELHWKNRLQENQKIVAAQLEGVAQLFYSFACAARPSINFSEEFEEKVAAELKRAGLVHKVTVLQTGHGRLITELEGPPCSGRRWCSSYLDGLVSAAMGQRYSLWLTKCAKEATGPGCKMVFLPERRFQVDVQSVRAARPGSLVCGDSFSQLKLRDGKLAFIISDGMGYGTKAALESGTTVRLLKQLLDYGFEREFAVSTVNSILLLRSPEDTFATVDLAIVDLFTGTVEFIKNGAAPSYILKQGGVVQRIQANSMPLGMLDRIDYYCERVTLDSGDMLVMVTDGVTDACAGAIEGDEWLLHFLASAERGDPTLAETLLNKVQKAVAGNRDDLTVVTVTLKNTAAYSTVSIEGQEVPVLTRL